MKFSIARLMIGVALIAIAFSLVMLDVKNPDVHRYAHEQVVGVLPMVTILTYGLVGAGFDIFAGRPTRRRLVGFQAGGWVAILAYLFWCALTYDWNERPGKILSVATTWALSNRSFTYDDPSILMAHMCACLAPELALAVLGGWIGSKLGIVMIKQGATGDRRGCPK